jgi:hypothetical protein
VEETRQDCFVVFVRDEARAAGRPADVEKAVASCASYEEADRIRQRLRGSGRHCVIRAVGETGGGD